MQRSQIYHRRYLDLGTEVVTIPRRRASSWARLTAQLIVSITWTLVLQLPIRLIY